MKVQARFRVDYFGHKILEPLFFHPEVQKIILRTSIIFIVLPEHWFDFFQRLIQLLSLHDPTFILEKILKPPILRGQTNKVPFWGGIFWVIEIDLDSNWVNATDSHYWSRYHLKVLTLLLFCCEFDLEIVESETLF